MFKMAQMKGHARRAAAYLFGNSARRQPRRAGAHKQANNAQARLLGQCGKAVEGALLCDFHFNLSIDIETY
jgi:hypothetical protein